MSYSYKAPLGVWGGPVTFRRPIHHNGDPGGVPVKMCVCRFNYQTLYFIYFLLYLLVFFAHQFQFTDDILCFGIFIYNE